MLRNVKYEFALIETAVVGSKNLINSLQAKINKLADISPINTDDFLPNVIK